MVQVLNYNIKLFQPLHSDQTHKFALIVAIIGLVAIIFPFSHHFEKSDLDLILHEILYFTVQELAFQ